MMYKSKLQALGALVLFVWVHLGCGSDSGTGSDPGVQTGARVVEGVDFDKLFAAPTASEIASVLSLWEGRDVSGLDVREEGEGEVQLGSERGTVRVLSHVVDGKRHFGAVIIPESAAASMPVLFSPHFGDGGLDVLATQLLLNVVIDPSAFIFAYPSFRSQKLVFDGASYESEGSLSPWDGEVDDGLAFLNVLLETTPQADPERISIVGLSGGATIGMLMALRDPRIGRIVDFFGPADFFGPFAQDLIEQSLLGDPADLPGIEFLHEELLPQLQAGDRSMADMRLELLRRSPIYFADRLPQMQIHHGTDDDIIPVKQSQLLAQALEAFGIDHTLFVYQRGVHSPIGLSGSLDRAKDFLSEPGVVALVDAERPDR